MITTAHDPDGYALALTATLRGASEETWRAGLAWYPAARRIAREHPHGAAILAALSPRVYWSVNVRKARETFAGATPTGLGRSVRMALDARARGHAALTGRKVTAFGANLAGDEDAVTVDTWHCKACGLAAASPTERQYREIADATRTVAARYGHAPCDIQAVAWLATRGIKPSDHEASS